MKIEEIKQLVGELEAIQNSGQQAEEAVTTERAIQAGKVAIALIEQQQPVATYQYNPRLGAWAWDHKKTQHAELPVELINAAHALIDVQTDAVFSGTVSRDKKC
jgi:hypothetical protein